MYIVMMARKGSFENFQTADLMLNKYFKTTSRNEKLNRKHARGFLPVDSINRDGLQ